MRLPEIKDELSACVDRLVPYLKDYGEKVALRDYEDKDRYYRVEDTEKWRLRYGDEVAEDIQKLLSFDFESISFNPHMCEMGFSISHGYSRGYYYYNPYSTKIEAYIDEEEGRYYDQYFGDGWGYEIREGYP